MRPTRPRAHVGTAILAFAIVGALVLAIAFAVQISRPLNVAVDSGSITCAPSSEADDIVFGFGIDNRGSKPVTLETVRPRMTVGLRSVQMVAVPAVSDGPGTLIGSQLRQEVPELSERGPLEGAAIAPHRIVQVVVSLTLQRPGSTGSVQGFDVTVSDQNGVSHTLTSDTAYGVAPMGRDGSAKGCT